MGKVLCELCKKKCVGSALKVQDKYFHVDCFKCIVCSSSLAQGGFFNKDGQYYCSPDYQRKFGKKCAACDKFVEGEVVTALGNVYHQKCFVCARCRIPFPTGEKVTFTGKECLCDKCMQIPIVTAQGPESPATSARRCGGCKEELREGQALIALDKQWHIWCFKCTVCGIILHGEYMGKGDEPYCEKDYQQLFGVRCIHCERFITGKVLQAGENHHFHPTCARCSKCGDPFGDGEEMFLQGGAIWHPHCGPGSDTQGEDSDFEDMRKGIFMNGTPTQLGRMSPGSLIDKDSFLTDLSRVYTYSYLAAEPTQGYLRRPIEPRPPKSPQFHRPLEGTEKKRTWSKSPVHKQGMKALVESIRSFTPRPHSPHMNNEEPLEYSQYPGGKPPCADEVPRIERDDFPAPPFPFTDPVRRRRWSGNSKEEDIEDSEMLETNEVNKQLKKEEEELSKIATGIGKVFLKTLKDREKLKAWKRAHLDPRNSSRTPSANKEPPVRLRYDNPVNASPSRDSDHPKLWDDDEFDKKSSFRSSTGRLTGALPNYNVVSSLRHVPKPGYGLSSRSPVFFTGRDSRLEFEDITFNGLEKTQSSEFSCGKSDVSTLSEHDRPFTNYSVSSIFRSTPYSDGFRGFHYPTYSPHLRRSMPNVTLHLTSEPPKLYPYHLLLTSNYRLPSDVDRCHLERHLSNEEFQALFHMTRLQFYRLPEWKRNDLKKRTRLF